MTGNTVTSANPKAYSLIHTETCAADLIRSGNTVAAWSKRAAIIEPMT